MASLDGLRGFAAFGVFLHHALITHGWLIDGVWQLPPSRFFSMVGQIGVSVFFMITGFLFWSKLIHERGRPRWVALYVGRVFRIGPVYSVAVAAMAAIVFWRVRFDIGVPLSTLLCEFGRWLSLGMLSSSALNGDGTAGLVLAGVTWTLQYEWCFYAALPLLALGARWPGLALPFSAVLVVVGVLWRFLGGPVWFGGNDAIYALLFACGMVCAAVQAQGLVPKLPHAVLSAGALSAVVLVFVLFPSAYGILPTAVLACGFFLVVAGGDMMGLLNSRAARRLGDVSFGIYLLQGPILVLAFANPTIRQSALDDARLYWLVVLAAAVVLVATAVVVHEWIERPGIRGGKALVKHLRHPIPLAAPAACSGRNRIGVSLGLPLELASKRSTDRGTDPYACLNRTTRSNGIIAGYRQGCFKPINTHHLQTNLRRLYCVPRARIAAVNRGDSKSHKASSTMRQPRRHPKPKADGAVNEMPASRTPKAREFRLRTCLRGGSIRDALQHVLSDCLFLNISMHGARLKVPAEMPLPPKVVVFDERLNISFDAEIRWQRGNEIGLYIRDGMPRWMPLLCEEGGRIRIAWGPFLTEPAEDRRRQDTHGVGRF